MTEGGRGRTEEKREMRIMRRDEEEERREEGVGVGWWANGRTDR